MKKFMNIRVMLLLHAICCLSLAQAVPESLVTGESIKTVHIPEGLGTVPAGNDFQNDTSEYCNKRSLSSDNFIIFWAKEYGDDPMRHAEPNKRFEVKRALDECERFYSFYVDKLKLVTKGRSVTDKYKIIFLVTGGKEQTAYGWGKDSVGVLWSPAVRINKYPYGVLAHELGHAFQYLASCDYGSQYRGAVNEMTAQYLLWQVYPEWMTFENYHLKDYLKKTHYAFLHQQNAYHAPYVFEYWSAKHGLTFYGELLRSMRKGEDAVATYQRITGTSQEAFNDVMFDAARRFVTWDIDRIRKVAAPYANLHATRLEKVAGGYMISVANCPGNYGYNAIRLQVPPGAAVVSLSFKGIVVQEGYRSVRAEDAGWRYGFVAVKKDGKRVYGAIHRAPEETVQFKVPGNTAYLWLVVSGAPKHHYPVSNREAQNSQWPYQFKISGSDVWL